MYEEERDLQKSVNLVLFVPRGQVNASTLQDGFSESYFRYVYEGERHFLESLKTQGTSLKTFDNLMTCTKENQKEAQAQRFWDSEI